MRAVLALLLVVAACSKQDEPREAPAPAISAPEIERGLDACRAYVTAVCACAATVPAAKEACGLAQALPEAIEVAKRLATNPKADPEDAHQAAGSIRKTVEHCIEETAKLPELGCR